MAQAARLGDRISHTNAYAGLIVGALAGAAIGAICVSTGGIGAVALAAAGGAGLGGAIGEFAAGFSVTETGEIVSGSADVATESRRAARATDRVRCDWHGRGHRIAEGSATVLVDGLPAARIGDRTTCGAEIATGSGTVDIGGPTQTVLPVEPEVPLVAELAVGALGLAAGVGAVALAGNGLKLAKAAELGKGLLGGLGAGTAGSVAGGAIWGQGSREQRQLALGSGLAGGALASGALAGRPNVRAAAVEPDVFMPKKLGQTEPGAVPATPELKAQMLAASRRQGLSAKDFPEMNLPADHPDLPASEARNFGDDVRPWVGDDDGTVGRVVGAESNPNGPYWQKTLPATEAEWRAGSAVQNDWNGDGGYVESPTKGMRGWIGSAAPQMSSDGRSMLSGQGEQIYVVPGSAQPSAVKPTPWNRGR